MKILVAGFYPNSWRKDTSWKIESRSLVEADALHEYDLIILKPILFGGLFPNYKDAPKNNQVIGQELGEQFAEKMRRLKTELWLAGSQGRVAIFPTIETTIYYRIPKPLNQQVRELNITLGRGSENYETKTISNLDLLTIWGIGFIPGAGESIQIVGPGHPMIEYLQLEKIRWDTSFSIDSSKAPKVLATDRDGFRPIATEVSFNNTHVMLLPESQSEYALQTLVRGMERVRNWHDTTKIRSQRELTIMSELTDLRAQMKKLIVEADEEQKKLFEAEKITENILLNQDSILKAACHDYEQGCLERNMGLIYRAFERLKKSRGGERQLREFLHWDEQEIQEWNRLRNSITRTANESERHPPKNDLAAGPYVTDQEFHEAVQAMKTFLGKYVDVLLSSQ